MKLGVKLPITILLFSSINLLAQDGPGGVGKRDGTSDMNLWLDANQIEGTITGNNVSVWNDESGSGNSPQQTLLNSKPNWHENTVNGFPIVSFDGGERLEGTFTGGLQSPVSVFTVAYFDSINQGVGNWDYIFSVGSQTGSNTMMNIARNQGGVNADQFINDDGTNVNLGPTLVGQQWDIINFSENNTAPFTSLNINGTTQAVTNLMATSLNTDTDYRVGDWADSPGGAYHLNGKIAEIILFKSILNSAETNIINSYLGAKYNIVVNNDKYIGDNPANDDNDRDVIGVGVEADGSNSSAMAAGLIVETNSNFDNGDYFLTGHSIVNNSINTIDANDFTATVQARWDRAWWVDVTNTATAITVNLSFNYRAAGLGGNPGGVASTDYKLLYRPTNSGNWTIVASATSYSTVMVMFNNVTITNDGYYTIGTTDVVNSPLGEVETSSSCKGPGGIGETDGSSNLKLWLNTQALNGSDAEPLVTYYDFSGNNNHATIFNPADIPVIQANLVNGNAAVEFDGNDHIEGNLDINLAADATVISVGHFRNNQGNEDNDYLISLGNPSTANRHLSIGRRKGNDASNPNDYYSWTGTSAIFGPAIATGVWNVFYQEQVTTGNLHNLYIDGNSQVVAPYPAVFSTTSSVYRIGEWQNKNNSGLDGYVAETIIFNRTLNSAERNIINSYLGGKYNLTVGGDQYTGDNPGNGDNDVFIAGIGTESDGSNTCANSGGMIISQNANFGNGDYLIVGIPQDTNAINTTDIAEVTSTITGRWERVWWADVTDAGSPIRVDVTFDYSDAGEMGFPGDNEDCYSLIYRSGSSGTWTIITTASSINGDQITFNNVPFASDGFYTLATCDLFNNPLPVKLTAFEAYIVEDSKVQLDWTTVSEINNDYFEIQKSDDGLNWLEVKKVYANGNSVETKKYSELDENPYYGISYYRLKQVDFNGVYDYSTERAVNFSGLEIITSYPNPVDDYFTLVINSSYNVNVSLQLYNSQGKSIIDKNLQLTKGFNRKRITVNNYSSGVYFVKVITSDGKYYDQIQIQVD